MSRSSAATVQTVDTTPTVKEKTVKTVKTARQSDKRAIVLHAKTRDWTVMPDATVRDATLADRAIDAMQKALDKNDFARVLLEIAASDIERWYIAPLADVTASGKPINRRVTAQFANAIKTLAYLGKIAPLAYVAVTVPSRTVNGKKIVGGTVVVRHAR